MKSVIEVENLEKDYGKLRAVNGISFEVKKGEVFGLLGENGAGKTTTLEIIEGLRKPTSGKVMVLGEDTTHGCLDRVKEKIGVQLQSTAYFDFLTIKEILQLFGSFYHKNISPLDLLEMVDLKDKANSLVKNLSGGQKQRFSIVASIVNDPEIVFLDEPTTGLDPLARRKLWDLIIEIKNRKKTVILTTHYMEEAEILCDRIAIMEKGKIIAMGETHKLIEGSHTPYRLNFISNILSRPEKDSLSKLGELEQVVGKSNHFELRLKSQRDLNSAIGVVQKISPESLTVGRASLEDLFLELTGKTIGEENA